MAPSDEAAWTIGADVAIVVAFLIIIYLTNENNTISRFCCMHKPPAVLLLTNKSMLASKIRRPEGFCAWDLLDGEHLYRGFKGGPLVVFFVRLVSFTIFWFVLLCQNAYQRPAQPPGWLLYFSNWAFVVFGMYGLLGLVLSAVFCHRATQSSLYLTKVDFNKFDQILLALLNITFTCSFVAMMFYWVLRRTEPIDVYHLDNFFVHGASLLMVMLDLALSRAPVVSYHFMFPAIFTVGYCVFMWLYAGATGFWTYSSLSWDSPSSPVHYVGMCALLVGGFALQFAVGSIRERIGAGRWGVNMCTRSPQTSQDATIHISAPLPMMSPPPCKGAPGALHSCRSLYHAELDILDKLEQANKFDKVAKAEAYSESSLQSEFGEIRAELGEISIRSELASAESALSEFSWMPLRILHSGARTDPSLISGTRTDQGLYSTPRTDRTSSK